MKIAMIGHKRIPSREGGVEVAVEELASRMAEKGAEVTVYNRSGRHVAGKQFNTNLPRNGAYRGIRIITVPTIDVKGISAFLYSVLATIHAVLQRYDCIHYHAEGSCAMLWFPSIFKIKTVATIHGLDWQRAKWGKAGRYYLRLGERCAVKYSDEIIVLSQNMQRYFREFYGRKTHLIPNGIHSPHIIPPILIRRLWGLEKDKYILYLGRIVPEKRIQDLIGAFDHISASGFNKKLVIAGGSSDTCAYMEKLKEKAGDNPNILFTDFVQGEILEELYSNAYIYVLPSELEGMPVGLLEAMSYGNCCLVSDIPECVEVVESYGLSFRHGDAGDLKHKLEYLLKNPAEVARFKDQASSFICRKYNWETVVEETMKLYRGQ